MMWVTFHSTLLLSVGAVFITYSETKDDYRFIGKMESKVKGRGASAEGRWKVCDSEFISSLCTYAPKPFLVLIWVWLNWCKEHFATNLLPQSLSGYLVWRLVNFIQAVGSPSGIFHVIVSDEFSKNPVEYMEVQILESLSAKMRQQPENVDHLRCIPIKTLR